MSGASVNSQNINTSANTSVDTRVDFGFADIPAGEKAQRVHDVFSNVAGYYDRMNDVMSFGMHRLWKRMAVALADITPAMNVLDIAGGSGDLCDIIANRRQGQKHSGRIVLSDINPDMLAHGARRMAKNNPSATDVSTSDFSTTETAANSSTSDSKTAAVLCDGEHLPFADRSFDRVLNAFGLRNMTNRQTALCEAHRVLTCGGQCGILEFTPHAHFPRLHRFYLTRILPAMGQLIANDSESYRYLGESILRFPAPPEMRRMFEAAQFKDVRCYQFAGGSVAFYLARRTR